MEKGNIVKIKIGLSYINHGIITFNHTKDLYRVGYVTLGGYYKEEDFKKEELEL